MNMKIVKLKKFLLSKVFWITLKTIDFNVNNSRNLVGGARISWPRAHVFCIGRDYPKPYHISLGGVRIFLHPKVFFRRLARVFRDRLVIYCEFG